MEQTEYKQIVARLEGLTDEQFEALLETLRQRKDADGVQRLVMARLAECPCCPHCAGTTMVKHGVEFGSQRFRCKGCGKTFTALTGTPFHRLRGKTKLLENAACMVDACRFARRRCAWPSPRKKPSAGGTNFWISCASSSPRP